MAKVTAVDAKLNLSRAVVLIVQSNQSELDILGQVFVGFGVKAIRKLLSIDEAESLTNHAVFDLIVVDGDFADGQAFAFIERLRRSADGPNRLAPVMLVTGHTPPSAIRRARDCGANFVVAKPITPKVMFDRLLWLVMEERDFVESDAYMGPDRRFRAFGPPPGESGRRADDLSAEVGRPSGPDLAQSEIDALLTPRRAVA